MKRAQIITLDAVSGIAVFIIFLAVFFALTFTLPSQTSQDFSFELLYARNNLELNLQQYPGEEFYKEYRVTKTTLDAFADSGRNLDSLLFSDSTESYGIGLFEQGFDTCIYFIDNDNTFIEMGSSSSVALGQLQSGSCDARLRAGNNICEGYEQSTAVVHPVLMDFGSVNENRVVQLNILACKF